MWSGTEPLQQDALRRGALQQNRVIEQRFHFVVDAAHLLVAGEQHKRAPPRMFQDLEDLLGRRGGELAAAHVRQVRRHVQQALGRVIEVAGHDQLARVLQSQARAQEVEIVTHRERRRREHHGRDYRKQLLAQDRRDVDGCGLQVDAAAAALDEIYGRRIVGLHPAP